MYARINLAGLLRFPCIRFDALHCLNTYLGSSVEKMKALSLLGNMEKCTEIGGFAVMI